jgi:geranylgeranyl reductase
MNSDLYDAIVVGGGPSGATAADDLSQRGWRVLMIDRLGRTKPCGGAIPPRLIKDFHIPDHLLVAKVRCARMISPRSNKVDIHIDNGFVGMVDRDVFDEWLRERAHSHGVQRVKAVFEKISRVHFSQQQGQQPPTLHSVRAKIIIGADGAKSEVARQTIEGYEKTKYVFAYHEIIKAPSHEPSHDPDRCDVYYQGQVSPDFYGWVFPHGNTMSVGTGSADKGFSLRSGFGTG